MRYASTGIIGLDAALQGGYPAGRITLVTGDTGTGKTLLGLQFLQDGLKQGDVAVLVTCDQPAARLSQDAHDFGLDLNAYLATNRLVILDLTRYFSALDVTVPFDYARVSDDMVRFIAKSQATRVVIDPIVPLIFHDSTMMTTTAVLYLRNLMMRLETKVHATVLALAQTSAYYHGYLHWVRSPASGIINLSMINNKLQLTIEKLRYTQPACTHCRAVIQPPHGIQLEPV